MDTDVKQAMPENGLTAWRRSYSRLRLLERQLVSVSRDAGSAADVERLYRQIEDLRQATTDLFTAAQKESVSRHVQVFRAIQGMHRLPAPPGGAAAADGVVTTQPSEPAASPPSKVKPAKPRIVRKAGATTGSRPLAVSSVGSRPT
ncbi:MAG: hypothetical protein JWQ33_310 [Ramlibacter sp.]|nr:hypothetical protein [Ramlibacter sp.]